MSGERVVTPEEHARLDDFVNRVPVRVTLTHRNVRDDWDAPSHGTGVLVRLGGRDFVFTVGHLGDSAGKYEPSELTVVFPRDQIIVSRRPGDSIKRVWGSKHPDVAVIELDPSDASLWTHMRPVTTEAMLDWREVSDDERVFLLGIPFELSSSDGASAGGMIVVTRIIRDVRSPSEPSEGHGFHLSYEFLAGPDFRSPRRIDPHGMSGGPIFALDRGEPKLLGLQRSTHADKYLWCEPIGCALELLGEHDDPAVIRAVREALFVLRR